MSSSGLIYAAIVGAWAAYLVPMWLRRQDELNTGRQTERFTTAIRILSRRGALERRYARMIAEGESELTGASVPVAGVPKAPPPADPPRLDPSERQERPERPERPERAEHKEAGAPRRATPQPAQQAPRGRQVQASAGDSADRPAPSAGAFERSASRAALLVRRRRTVVVLFMLFTVGAVVAGIGGLAWLWVPALPGVGLSVYIGYLRVQERRRYETNLRRRLHADPPRPRAERPEGRPERAEKPAPRQRPSAPPSAPPSTPEAPRGERPEAARPRPAARPRAERPKSQTPRRDAEERDHAEWIAGLADEGSGRDAWNPVPVPLPTYVTAPVVPRGGADDEVVAPKAPAAPPKPPVEEEAPVAPPTPLFDQYAEEQGRLPRYEADPYGAQYPRAVNE